MDGFVDTVINQLIQGTYRRMLVLTKPNTIHFNPFLDYSCSPSNCIIWIEGIGSTSKLFYLSDGLFLGFQGYLTCVFHGTSLIYQANPLIGCFPTGIPENDYNDEIKIYIDNYDISIINESGKPIEAIQITDVIGRIKYNEQNITDKNITIRGLLESTNQTFLILNLRLSDGAIISRKLFN